MNLHFAGLHRLIFTPVFIMLGILAIRNCLKILLAIKKITHPTTQPIVLPNFSSRKQITKTILLICSLFFLALAWLQPQWGKQEQTVVQEGRDVLILLDVSRSMLAEDLSPTRLDFAKLKIRNLLERLTVERVGLILFSGSAFVQCPLTSDRSAFMLFLDQVDQHTISGGTTAIDGALRKAIEVFESSGERKNKLTLLMTDGEDFSTNLSDVQHKARELGITLFILGIGSKDGAPVPKFDYEGKRTGCETDQAGTIVLTKLNEPLLEETAKKLNGFYLTASYDDQDINRLVGTITSFEKERFNDKKLSLYEEQYHWFLAIAWILLALEWIL